MKASYRKDIKMKTLDFTKALKQLLTLDKLYPNTIPDEDLSTGVFIYDSESSNYVNRGEIHYQFLTSGTDRNACESKSSDILVKLNTLIFPLVINNTVIEGLIIKQFEPIYIGFDKNKYLFSFNLTLFIEKERAIN